MQPQNPHISSLSIPTDVVILEDGLFTRDEENALNRYMNLFNLNTYQLDRNGVPTQVVKSALLRDIAEGIVPERQTITGSIPFKRQDRI